MAIYKLRIFVIAAAVATSILLLFGAYTQGVTPNNVGHMAKNIVSHVPGTGSSDTRKLAYMTLLTATMNAPEDPAQDHYFMATRILGYQLLHQPSTKTQKKIPFVVLVTKDVKQDRRDLLTGDGATVLQVENVDVDTTWIVGEMPQWKDLMTKLRAWELVKYDLVAFLDGDFILNRCMDGIFDDPAATTPATLVTSNGSPADEGALPETYVLATVAEANPIHNYPPLAGQGDYKDPNYFNAGFFVFRPDLTLFNHFKTILSLPHRFDPKYMEQNLLNYAFRRGAQMPWIEMDGSWHIRFPNVRDKEAGVASMHDKWWSAHMDKNLQPFYDSVRWRMEGYYEVSEVRKELTKE
ncbi:nucleotide-diphospho-sugar transferase [Aureobasidium subglaciale]|nr:nucleotide-diphospho-sugar transferase [Aureobasidium subglaciale]